MQRRPACAAFPAIQYPTSPLRATQWVADVIYTPIETDFIKAARLNGARTLNGGGMCAHQAVEAFRCLTGATVDIARLQRAFAKGVAARDAAVSP